MNAGASDIVEKAYRQVLNELKTETYVLADTRVEYITLYDHLILTAGIATAIAKELLIRGRTPEEICGVDISQEDLLTVIRVSALLHDWGKAHEEKYRGHVERGTDRVREWLMKNEVVNPYFDLILSAVKRHQTNLDPQTFHEKIVCLADSMASAADRPELARAKSWNELLKVSSSNLDLEREIFGDEKGLVLILGDVDRVKSYVFETTKLPEIRGASEILNNLNGEKLEEIFQEKLCRETLIYNGGGSFLAVVPKGISDEVIKQVENSYLKDTEVATITCVKSHPLGYIDFARGLWPYVEEDIMKLNGKGTGDWLLKSHYGGDKKEWSKKKNFGELVSLLSSKLRKEKESKSYLPFYEAVSIGRRCISCGKRIAVQVIIRRSPETGITEEEQICEICNIKRKASRKWRFVNDFKNWCKDKKAIDIDANSPEDLDQLVKGYDGYMAFIYADGNDIGSLLEKTKSPAHYRHIAESLQNGTTEALFEGLYSTLEKQITTFNVLPFEIINIGGDDITLIIAASFAWRFCISFLERFQKNLEGLQKELSSEVPITASLGMVIAKSNYPVYYAEKIAESLLKSAKRKFKESKESALSYLYLTTSIAAEDSNELIRDCYGRNGKILTLRPYTLKEAKVLWDLAKHCKELFSTSQRNLISRALDRGVMESINFLLYQVGRMRQDKRERAVSFLKRISTELNFKTTDSLFIWKTDSEGRYVTPLLDILEIIKFSGREVDG